MFERKGRSMNRKLLLVVLANSMAAAPVLAENVALNKPVTIVAGAGSLLAPTPSFGVVTDGAFLPEATPYSGVPADLGSIRWNSFVAGHATLEIQLGDFFTIDGIIVQADDNDSLEVTYLAANGTFQPLYSVPFISVGFGFLTRPDSSQATYAPLSPVTTTTIRVTSASGDGFFGISELQLSGSPATAPCFPDCDASGALTIDDFICFQTFFAIGDPYADCDASGNLSIDDFICFQTFFAIGC
jgi:hypothetical protein